MKIVLPQHKAAHLKRILRQAGRQEVGGILMGEQIEPGYFKIHDFSVDNITGSAAHFVRSVDHHKAALDRFFSETGCDYTKYNYLGEWHSHPSFDVRPSKVDMLSMQSLVKNETNISFAVLMIIRLKYWAKLEASITVFHGNGHNDIVSLKACSLDIN